MRALLLLHLPLWQVCNCLMLVVGVLLNSLALYIFCGASTPSSASVVYTINLAVADLLVALSLPARIALYHSGGRCEACSYVHTFSYFVNMYCSILFLTRWVEHSFRANFHCTVSSFCPSSQHLYRSIPGSCPRVRYAPSVSDHRNRQVCQRHSLGHCSGGHLLFPGEETSWCQWMSVSIMSQGPMCKSVEGSKCWR